MDGAGNHCSDELEIPANIILHLLPPYSPELNPQENTQKKQIAVVAWGSTVQQDIQPRDFIIDADTGQSQPQSVAMQQSRYCNIDIVPGVEGPSPTYPSIDSTDLLIGYVLCDPTGIVSFQQAVDNQLDIVVPQRFYVQSSGE